VRNDTVYTLQKLRGDPRQKHPLQRNQRKRASTSQRGKMMTAARLLSHDQVVLNRANAGDLAGDIIGAVNRSRRCFTYSEME